MRTIQALLFFSFITVTAIAQDSSWSNTLLWRISGNQIRQPSYLYGTMHVTDKRVFQLGDSVFKALESTEGFAAELDMNRLGAQMINRFIKEEEDKAAREPVLLKGSVSPEIWKQYRKQLEKKLGKKAENITVDDLDDVETRMQQDMFRKGDMPTFLDAWLFGLAKQQGKWVGGLEKIEDQMEHMEASGSIEQKIQTALYDDEYYRKGMDQFIGVYTRQSLDTIDAMMYREESGEKDLIMIKRNHTMARGIDSLSAIRSTLFAVGAAHLPGDSGVIALLRRMGFTVTPVFSSVSVNPDKYTYREVQTVWPVTYSRDSTYHMQMPGVAEGIEKYSSLGLDMKMYFDLSFMKMYITMNVLLPEARKEIGEDSLFVLFREQYEDNGELVSEKNITVNGVAGRQYRFRLPEGEMRMQLFAPGMERIIVNMLFSFKASELEEESAEKYFKSFVLSKDRRVPGPEEKTWHRVTYSFGSFSVEIPGSPALKRDAVSQEGKTLLGIQSYDQKNGVFYGASISGMKAGMYESSLDSSYFLSLQQDLLRRFSDSHIVDSSFFTRDNCPAYRFVMKGKQANQLLEINVLMLRRGGNSYYLFSLYEPGEKGKTLGERYLQSFTLLPYHYGEWKQFTATDSSFVTRSRLPFTYKETVDPTEEDVHPGAVRYALYDTLAHVSMYADRLTIPDWYWGSSDTALLRIRAQRYISPDDTLSDYVAHKENGMSTADFTVRRPGTHVINRVRLVVSGNNLYEVFGHMSEQELAGGYEDVFTSFRPLDPGSGVRVTDRQTSRDNLAKQFQHPDPAGVAAVKSWWPDLSLDTADLPMLREAMFRLYPDFDTAYYGNLNRMIVDKVQELDSNHITLDYIRDHYAHIEPGNEYVKPFLLQYLARIKTNASYLLLKDCLVRSSLNIDNGTYFWLPLYDSLQLTALLYPDLMSLAGHESLTEIVCGSLTWLIDSNRVDPALVRPYEQQFLQAAGRVLGKEKNEVEFGDEDYGDLIRILGILNTEASIQLLRKFASFDNRYLQYRSTLALMENRQTVDQASLLTLASTDEYRSRLYEDMKKYGLEKRFPAEYLTQSEMGKSLVYGYAEDDDTPYVVLLGQKTVKYKGKQVRVYLYSVSFTDGDSSTSFLGVAGPYSLNAKNISCSEELTGVYWSRTLEEGNKDELFAAFLAEWEDE